MALNTDLAIKNWKPGKPREVKPCGHRDGLYIRANASGEKTFYWRKGSFYRLGQYPSLTLSKARAMAAVCNEQAKRGVEPEAIIAALREAGSLADVASMDAEEIAAAPRTRVRTKASGEGKPTFDQVFHDFYAAYAESNLQAGPSRKQPLWSTDWFYNRQAEIERLRQALLSAQNHAVDGVKIDGANKARPTAPAPAERAPVAVELPEVAARQMPAYTRADFRINAACEPHEAPLGTLAELATKIVYAEGPIHFEEVARRLASAFGKEKAGKRIVAATQMALSKAQAADSVLRCDGDFWFTTEQAESPPVRDRSNEEGATIKASNISMLEIKAALRIAKEDNAGGETADLVRAAARLLGFRRVGGDLQARLAAGLETT